MAEGQNAAEKPAKRVQMLRCRASTAILIPPVNFGLVEEGLYRSGQPTELNFPFLERLNLKTLCWLAPEEPSQRFLDFIDDQGIKLHHLGALNAANAWDPITEETVIQALEIIIDPACHPVMVMCNLGRHRTGTAIGCLRKLQRWNLASIFEEYRRFAGPKVRVLNEQFIELWDCDLVSIPPPAAPIPPPRPEPLMEV
ncbi:uncharacterized protein L969DRAFT_93254 [Mixia osmundae IAM 14324]|uniref:Putative tyrosine-protein phosphatase OCA1 n=1 Tax=Mixia osmundae (strain CBS 9802 / IAM 14324 / JCM 22182 / KY 12970) TaxID=764103 RepID=G7E5M5_MIXOS|nr:uncharacterized protein L969DRAFT_93254 [Mixia osmundae IAM 14324]KEI40717.1 hypothetical protein L969DRAFT_93254 [Mixia osmundae IAM 14324]GAA98135.1 hypothetical protein E5Q_04818 [Mixia osmundae IAM 14324]